MEEFKKERKAPEKLFTKVVKQNFTYKGNVYVKDSLFKGKIEAIEALTIQNLLK